MKLVPWTIAAFVSTRSDNGRVGSSSSTTARHVFPVAIDNMATITTTTSSNAQIDVLRQASATTSAIREWLVPSAEAAETPSAQDVELLQRAMAAFYGTDAAGKDRDLSKAEELLTKTLAAWKGQPVDERASLYRIRGDTYMGLGNARAAATDYSAAIDLLDLPEGDLADPSEAPTARLGRARAIRSLGDSGASKQEIQQAAKDYQIALRLSSREDWDTDKENEEDGAARNPFAAWEWGHALRAAGDYQGAARAHALASYNFNEIGDRARSVIAAIDSGIDSAATSSDRETVSVLEKAIKRTTSVEGRDVDLLQRVIAKEGEGRIALASVLWNSGEKQKAEAQLGNACIRLEQLEADAQERLAKNSQTGSPSTAKVKFSIDDSAGPFEIRCSRFKNDKFLSETLEWPTPLQAKVTKLENLD